MTADVKLLPLPEPECMGGNDVYGVEYPLYTSDHMQSYARANVAHATAAKDAEIEALRAELAEMRKYTVYERMKALEARAERLAEALRGMMAEYESLHAKYDLGECQATVDARAALNPIAAQDDEAASA